MLYFIINPSSRSRKGYNTWKKIEKELKKEKVIYQTIISKSSEDVIQAAKQLTSDQEEKIVVLLGGDGTLNAFVNGMYHTRGIRLACLPIGSGNDFARGMGITRNYKEEINLILHDKQTRQIHYGIVHYKSGREKRFLVSTGIGYDARVCYYADRSRIKKFLNLFGFGHLVYLITGLRYLLNAKTFKGELLVDQEPALEGNHFLFSSFQMLPFEGGGFKFCPNQRPESNKLHICAVEGIAKWKLPFIVPQAFIGTHIHRKGVYQFECDEASIQMTQPQYVHTDGETDHKYDGIYLSVSRDTITFLN